MAPHSTTASHPTMAFHDQITSGSRMEGAKTLSTKIIAVGKQGMDMGDFADETLDRWVLPKDLTRLQPLVHAAKLLTESSTPVAFPTETVYGLGADATRSNAVKGIYTAKGRPSDNPLIIHVCDLTMLRALLVPAGVTQVLQPRGNIPGIYDSVIAKFWPGPLTILLRNPVPSKLAPEVTAGLTTFGARMPSSSLALSLIKLAGVPLAAPSANASTKPSPTTAQHVLHDLNGKIEIILDGGPCQVGVESTVIDGLCTPPVVLRPGGISIDQIRECAGWENVVKGYKDSSEIGSAAPRAPGMKYKHYSPKATVILYEFLHVAGHSNYGGDSSHSLQNPETRYITQRIIKHFDASNGDRIPRVGVVTTKRWNLWPSMQHQAQASTQGLNMYGGEYKDTTGAVRANLFIVALGKETKDIARGLFSALRELDARDVDVIHVEGIDDNGDIAAAVMNRLRKAATVIE